MPRFLAVRAVAGRNCFAGELRRVMPAATGFLGPRQMLNKVRFLSLGRVCRGSRDDVVTRVPPESKSERMPIGAEEKNEKRLGGIFSRASSSIVVISVY